MTSLGSTSYLEKSFMRKPWKSYCNIDIFRLKCNLNINQPRRDRMNYISRNLEEVVLEVTKEYPVVLVTGPR